MGDNIMGYVQTVPHRPNSKPKDFLWIRIDVWTLPGQRQDGRKIHALEEPKHIDDFEFIAPNEIQEHLSHNWEPFDSMTGRLSQTVAKAGNLTKQVAGAKTGTQEASKLIADTPLIFTGSDRRKFQFTVQFLNQSRPDEAMGVINKFRSYSCGKIGEREAIDRVDFPFVFGISTIPVTPIVYIERAALISIQSTYEYPFIGGLASKASMTLDFIDLSPMYDVNFAGLGNVIVKGV